MAKELRAKKEPVVVEKSAQPTAGLSKADMEALKRAREKNVSSQWWQPQADGDYIIGTLIGRAEQDSQFKEKGKAKKQTVLTLDRGGNDGIAKVACNIVLQNELERLQPVNGDRLLVCYRGFSSGAKRGKPARLFTVEIVSRGK